MSLNRISTFRFRYFALFGLISLTLWAAIYIALQTAEREALEKARAEGRNLARSLAEHVASSVRSIDLVLLQLREEWGEGRAHFISRIAQPQKDLKQDIAAQVTIIGADGKVLYSYLPDPQHLSLADRQYFKVHKERDTDELYVSEPFVGRLSGQWIIQFTRAMYDRRRQFAGVIVLTVPPPELERVYNDIELGDGAIIGLVRPDGQFLAHSRDLAKAATVSVADIAGLGPNDPPAGEIRRNSKVDGIERLYRHQKVPGYPFRVIVGQSVYTVLTPYRAQRAAYLGAGILATALLLAVTLLLISRRREEEEANRQRARLARDLRDRAEQLRLLFDSFPIAIAHVDNAERITFANRVYCSDYGSNPDGRHLREFVGEQIYSVLKPYVERALAGEQIEFESSFVGDDGQTATRLMRYVPDRNAAGEVIGFFGFREDITERRRAEEKIRKLNEELEQRVHERTADLNRTIGALQAEVNERRQAEASALGLAERLQKMARRLGEAQEVERRRLAAELHDGVCSNLAAIGLNLVLLQKQLPVTDAAGMERRVSGLITLIDEAKSNAKDISVDLRPLLLENRDLLSALEEYARKFEGSTGIAIAVKGVDAGRRLQAEEKIALFRITQEALTNCARHAQAKAIAIELNAASDHLVLSIADDGVGIDLNGGNGKTHGLGLLSMQERAEAIGGKWRIESAPGRGTRVMVSVYASAVS